jgi:hypothetical protein
MNQSSSNSKKQKLEPIPFKGVLKPESIDTLNKNEAFDKFGGERIDGLKIVSIESTTVTPTGHIVAYYKGIKVLIPIAQ